MALEFPLVDPVAVQVGSIVIRWYALAYIAGILLGWNYINVMIKRLNLLQPSVEQVEAFISWAIMGIVLGGRAGYVAFYNWGYYQHHLNEILYIWQGGMSFHGGMLGVFIAMLLFAKKHSISMLRLSDVITAAAPIGLFFGRIANFINGELYGRISDASWAVVFPRGGDLPRHPSQLYESALEGLVMFLILFALMNNKHIRSKAGFVSGAFLCGYGTARFLIEYVREPDEQIGLLDLGLSMGQALSVPMVVIGVSIMVIVWFRPSLEEGK